MSEPMMKIRPFTIKRGGEQLLATLQDAMQRPLNDRYLPTRAGGRIRIDNLRKVDIASPKETLWLMNFARSREGHGPVKIPDNREKIEPIDYKEDERPGEEIAALFAPAVNCMLIHTVQHFSIGTIRDYINVVAGEPFFNLEVMIDDETHRKFQIAGDDIRKVNFALDTRLFTQVERKAGMAVGAALNMASASNAATVEVKLSASKGAPLDDVRNSIDEMLKAYQECQKDSKQKESGVKKLEVAVLDPDRRMEVMNLLAPLMQAEYAIPLDKNRRFPLRDRYNALQKAYAAWRKILRAARSRASGS